LFEVDPAERVDPHPLPPKLGLLLAPSLDEWLPTEHLARLVAELVDEQTCHHLRKLHGHVGVTGLAALAIS
jgi:hypothetical protein